MRVAWASPIGRGFRFVAIAAATVVVLMLLATAAAPSVNRMLHTERIYPGVQVVGIDVSGQTVDQATATIDAELTRYEDTTLKIRAGDNELQLTAAELGFIPRDSDIARVAFAEARIQGPVGFVRRAMNGQLLGQTDIAESTLVDDQAVDAAVAKLAAGVYRAPVDAVLTVKPQLVLKPSSVGQSLDQEGSRHVIRQHLLAMSSEEIVLPTTPLDPKLPTAVFQPVHDQAAAILARGITLTIADPVGNRTWSVPSAVLQDSLVLKTSPYSLDVQSDVFSPLVSQIAKDLARSPIDATLSVKDDLVRLTSDQVGWQVDQTATLASLRARILASGDTTGVVVNAVQAKVRISDLSPTATEVSTIIAKGIKLSVGGKVGGDGNEAVIQTLAATPAEVGNMLVIKPGLDGKLTISIDADRVSQLVDRLSLQYQYPSLTARFVTWNGTKAQVKVGAKIPAILIDKPKAVAAIAAGWRGGTVSVGTVFGEMTVDQAFADRLTADLKGVFKTRSISFAVSSPERAHNISLALSRINGTIVAPGEVYSFNISTGPTTIAAGYTWGFAFLTDKKTGQNLVVPSEAGGICQVATSVFQPVYLSGYTIEERNYHMFNLRSYAVNGYYGLDATVYPPYADMKFRNDTSQYLMISAGTRGRATYVGLVGTKPNWTVSLSKERIYDVKAPPPEPIMTTSDLFAAGRTITLEHPTNGFTTEVTRTVTYPDGTVRTLTLKSKYLPTPLQVLVGTGTSNPH